jgi:Dyp-type peroxidase family
MPLDLNSNKGPIDYTDEQYQDVLEDLQGNILKGHGRNQSVQIFLNFPDPKQNPEKIVVLKQWIAQFAAKDITSAIKQLRDADQWRTRRKDGGIFVHFALSSSGYEKLGFPDSSQPKGANLQNRPRTIKPPQQPQEVEFYADVFQQGMRQRRSVLLDPSATTWEREYQTRIDALIILAANNDSNELRKKTSELRQQLKDIATIVKEEQGDTLRKQFGNSSEKLVVEHFGYADGIGQPLFLLTDVEREKGETAQRLFSAPLNLVLIPDPFGTHKVSFGSFLVFRKLEQNVQAFKKAEEELGKALGISPKVAGAMAVGRFEDGTPIVLQPNDGGTVLNDFEYSNDTLGLKCPFHAHLRKTNPRLESVLKDGPFAQSEEQELGHRIARRGVTYGGLLSEFDDLDSLPTGNVGLLFMCYQSDIWEQFEFIQRFWSNAPSFVEPALSEFRDKNGLGKVNPNYDRTGLDAVSGQNLPGQSDPVIGEVPKPPQNWPEGWNRETTKPGVNFEDFVKLKGGEYFFSPSISFLKNLPNLPEDSTEPPIQEPIPGQRYVVQPGDFLFLIAERAYGDGNLFQVIYEANRNVIGSDPTVLVPGQVLFIPKR